MSKIGDNTKKPDVIELIPFPDAPRIHMGESALRDLEIEELFRLLHSSVPGDKFWCREFIRAEIKKPFFDLEAISLRQEAIRELLEDNNLCEDFSAVKAACERFKYRRIYNGGMESGFDSWRDSLQRLENTSQLVQLALAINHVAHLPKSRLSEICRFGRLLEGNDGFREVRSFVEDVYLRLGLGDALYVMQKSNEKEDMRQETSKKEMESSAKIIMESADEVIKGNYLAIEDEPRIARLIKSRIKKCRGYSSVPWRQSDYDKNLAGLAKSLVDGINHLICSRLPSVQLGNMDCELAFYLGAAMLCRQWIGRGIPVVKPVVMIQQERRCKISAGRNITLLGQYDTAAVPNDILWDRNENIFVLTGPNNGGKTTYIRMVGQLMWMAQSGLMLPVESAAVSMIDGIYTSFTGGDDSSHGEGHYAAELSRIAKILLTKGDSVTPYSLIMMDEFATGTDNEEAARISCLILSHLSERGTTTFFTTHRPEAADLVEEGKLPGGVNLAPEIRFDGDTAVFTYRMRRHAREGSYGYLQAERLGITPERLQAVIEDEIGRCIYPMSDTRVNRAGAPRRRGRGDND
ncbi:MAG: hypothetical protein NTW65_09440 [Deltaproteobacteria bacterium]|nr:hypothetical protein [Deltaproteobacteria bacterium]